MDDKNTGLYHKYRIERTDGSSGPGGKHERCFYFVLDLKHDPHAFPALKAYAESARAGGYEALANDLDKIVENQYVATADIAPEDMVVVELDFNDQSTSDSADIQFPGLKSGKQWDVKNEPKAQD